MKTGFGLEKDFAGTNTTTDMGYSHAEGGGTIAKGRAAHAEGLLTEASGDNSHAEGSGSSASGASSHAEGLSTTASGSFGSHAEGVGTTARGENGSHAEGIDTKATGDSSHAEGAGTVSSGEYAHAEGFLAKALGEASHSEGGRTEAIGMYSHAEGHGSRSEGTGAHAEGQATFAGNCTAHAEGRGSVAVGEASHAAGIETRATGLAAHAEGVGSAACGAASHAEGTETEAAGQSSHAEGVSTLAAGIASHAEGIDTKAIGSFSHAEGNSTSTKGHKGAHIMGRFGDAGADYGWFMANGSDNSNRNISARILNSGEASFRTVTTESPPSCSHLAEMFETVDGQHIEPGFFVTLAGDKIRKANSGDDYLLGVSSANPAVLIGSAELSWQGKYLLDEWGRPQSYDMIIPTIRDKAGKLVKLAKIECELKINPAWNRKKKYVPRARRREWAAVGLIGQILVRDDGTCQVNGLCRPNDEGVATAAAEGYRVLKRTGPNQLVILFR